MQNATVRLLVPLTLLAWSAHASDRVSYPYTGVVHVHRVLPGFDAHVVTVDLAAATDVVVTRPGERYSTVTRFAAENDAQIAINANFFDASVCGLAVGDRRVWRDSYVENCHASFGFGPEANGWHAEMFNSANWLHANPFTWATQVVTGWPVLLDHGEVVFEEHEPNGMYRTHPRTAIGLAADRSTFIIAVIDGRRAGIPGATSVDMIPLLEEFGAQDAINLDGGGSSALWIGSEGGIVNHPADGEERPVMNHLGIRVAAP